MANIKKGSTAKIVTGKGSYSYKYTELADINDYIDSIGETYYQYIERIETDDYIMTCRQKNGEYTHIRGLRVIQPVATNNNNIYQVQGIGTTYERRYSLLMAYGLATEDDDSSSLYETKESEIKTEKEALSYKINFGKHKGETIGELDEGYCDWLYNNTKDENIKKALEILGYSETTDEEVSIAKDYSIGNLQELIFKTNTTEELVLKNYNVEDISELTEEQRIEAINILERKMKKWK